MRGSIWWWSSVSLCRSTEISALRRGEPCVRLHLPVSPPRATRDHEVITVDHFGAAADPEYLRRICRRAALDLVGIVHVVSHQPAPDFMAIRARTTTASPRANTPSIRVDARRQQAFSGIERVHRAGVDNECTLGSREPSDPSLARGDGVGGRQKPCAASTIGDGLDWGDRSCQTRSAYACRRTSRSSPPRSWCACRRATIRIPPRPPSPRCRR